jgi:GGDEF domain-containing protein
MTDDPFFDRLRDEARALRYDAGDAACARLSARVRERVATPLTVSQLLALWFRPLTATVAALALTASIGITWYQQTHEPVSVEQISAVDTASDNLFFGGE